jgi:hypothetical protein
MITCKTVTGMHTDAREGALGPWQRFRYGFHMKICAPCKAYAKSLDQTLEALRAMPPEPAPDDVKARAVAKLRERGRAP